MIGFITSSGVDAPAVINPFLYLDKSNLVNSSNELICKTVLFGYKLLPTS